MMKNLTAMEFLDNNLTVVEYLKSNLTRTKLHREVIQHLNDNMLEYEDLDTWIGFVSEIITNGLASGIMGTMIYPNDVEKFAIEHLDDIIDLIDDLEIEIKAEHDFLTELAYTGYEGVCNEILDVLEELDEELDEFRY